MLLVGAGAAALLAGGQAGRRMGRMTTPDSEQRRLVSFTTPVPPSVSPSAIDAPGEDTCAAAADLDQQQPATPLVRALLGTVLPIIMITVGMVIQRSTRLAALEAEALEQISTVDSGLPQRTSNFLLLNRSCDPSLMHHYSKKGSRFGEPFARPMTAADGDRGARLIVGAGFMATGLSAVSSILARVPGACQPIRANLGFWNGVGSVSGGGGGRRGASDAAVFDDDNALTTTAGQGLTASIANPAAALLRQRYLRDFVRFRGGAGERGGAQPGGCSFPWEVTERYSSITGRHVEGTACVPLAVRHYFPNAHIVMMVADPIQRAHAQQTLWLHNRCYRDANEARSARNGARALLAKGASPGCEKMDATSQLRIELRCVRSCKLRVDSPMVALQQCAATCGRALRTAFPCKASTNCPYLSLINSHFSLLLPVWLATFPCDHVLLLDRQTFFEVPGSAPSVRSSRESRARRRARLRQRHFRSPPFPPPPSPPPPPPEPKLPSTPLLGLLRFLGLPADNASHVAQLQQRYRLVAPTFGTAANPIEPWLQRELDRYFQPFQAHVRKLLSAHRKCYNERMGLKRKVMTAKSAALARAG